MTHTFVSIPLEDWQRVVSILERVEERLKPQDEWIGTKEACKMLGITPNTWVSYRKKFNIQCSQVGRNVLVMRSQIEKLLKQREL